MTKTKLLLLIASLAVALLASAADKGKKHDLTLFDTVKVGAAELHPGEYKVVVNENTATFFRDGQMVAQVPCRVEESGAKFETNATVTDETHTLKEIQFGGSTEKVFLQ